jgi:hypothetical protein
VALQAGGLRQIGLHADPQAAVEGCLLFRRCLGVRRHATNGPKWRL